LQHHYNQEQGGDGQLKPPAHYNHPAVTISQEEKRQMERDCRCAETSPMYALSTGEAREWYGIAKLKQDQPLVDRVEKLGTLLQQRYNQEQSGSGHLKPPSDYRHSSVMIPVTEQHQIEQDLSAWQRAIVPKPQVFRKAELAL
jgi:hypothetical protein